MNSAMENLKRSNPRVFEQFMKALTEDLGVNASQTVVSFSCPSCNARLEVIVAEAAGKGRGRRGAGAGAPRASRSSDGLNDLLIELARHKRTTTGTINALFKKEMGKKIKNMDKRDQRAQKVEWLKVQLGQAA